jgi:hypothetical protein
LATLAEVDEAVQGLLDRLSDVDPELRRRYAVERTVACRVRDLQIVYLGRFDDDGVLQDVRTAEHGGDAQVKLLVSSDDLIALIDGQLSLPAAWATGRLKVDASMLDLLKLRSLL